MGTQIDHRRGIARSKLTRPNILRSALARPPRPRINNVPDALKSTSVEEQNEVYSLLGLIQYLSSAPKTDVPIQYGQPSSPHIWSRAGSGQTYVVRRFSTGTADEMYEADLFRASDAIKTLRSFVGCSAHKISLQYRAIIQEIRILRHRPLAEHPNFPKIVNIGWELDPMNLSSALPSITTEFSAWGTLASFLHMFEETDWEMKGRLILDVVEGLTALHACSVVHGDMKMENVLVFSDGTEPGFPVIAKISDFGFCLDLSEPGDYGRLVGYTALWAAPEASQRLMKHHLSLTDVYSLGFIIWSVCIDGRSPFDELRDTNDDEQQRVYTFNFLRESNELVNEAKENIVKHSSSTPIAISLACEYLDWTLQYTPDLRRLDKILVSLRETSYRRKSDDSGAKPVFCPITPLNKRMQIIRKWFWDTPWSHFSVIRQVTDDLRVLVQTPGGSTFDRSVSAISKVNNLSSDYFIETGPNKTVAAMNLAYRYIFARNSEKSIQKAMHYLHMAAQHGLGLAQWVCLRMKQTSLIQITPDEEQQWKENAAKAGAKLILSELKAVDPDAFHACLTHHKTYFWALKYGIAEKDILELCQTNDMDRFSNTARGDDLSHLKGRFGNSILHTVALVGALGLLQTIVASKKTSIDTLNDRGETPLLLACRCGHGAVVEYLLAKGADASKANIHGQCALHWLDSFEEDEIFNIAELLCLHGADVNQVAEPDHTFFGDTSRRFHDLWLSGTPLHQHVASGNMRAVKALLSLGAKADVICQDFTPIDRAAQLHRADMLEVLLSSTPAFDLNQATSKSGLTPLHRAIVSADPFLLYYHHGPKSSIAIAATICELFAKGAQLPKMRVDPILFAVTKGANQALELILQYQGQNLERRKVDGDLTTNNPLLESVFYEDENAFNILLDHGADPNAVMHFGQHTHFSTLHLCVSVNHQGTKIAERLLEKGIDVNDIANPYASDTPLCYALQRNQFHLVDVLLKHGALLTACSKISERGNVLGELLYCEPGRYTYNALQYLSMHPLTGEKMPHYVHEGRRVSVYHMICSISELRRRNFSPADFVSTFALLQKMYPSKSILNAPDVCGFTPLHYAIYVAFPEGVQALLEAGADPFSCAQPDPWSDSRDDEWIGKPLIEFGTSVIAMVQHAKFATIHSAISPVERQDFLKRRQQVKDLLAPYISEP